MSMRSFAVPTSVMSGLGSLERLPNVLEKFDIQAAVIVVDSGLVGHGIVDFVLSHAPNLKPLTTLSFSTNPPASEVDEASEEARRLGAKLVIGIGGGSALGAAKAIAIRLTNDGSIFDYEGSNKVLRPPAPCIAIPTTAGSGSEVSNALVLHVEDRSTELVVRGQGCEPRVAFLDGRVLRLLPEAPMTYAALDALSHGLESLWSQNRSFFTDCLASGAIKRIVSLLPVALEGIASGANALGNNDEVLQGLLEASCAANMACGNSGLGLVHALSSSPEIPLPHGLQNGILLPHVAEFNAQVSPTDVGHLVGQIHELYERISFDPTFAQPVQIEKFIRASQNHPFRENNLRASTDDDLAQILVAAGAVAS
ncbi:MAG: iron-containing alcohol dehydrogenase [Actinobacteria bacterium]|uniref:Unannotated protein n=1 Tax=freshwater metagenome TaxID=449393 RepID=A0A6J7FZU0_9ZZZZ|nr:iron-containing alcohol dehydrogenase [Actinomycetota bacterium]